MEIQENIPETTQTAAPAKGRRSITSYVPSGIICLVVVFAL